MSDVNTAEGYVVPVEAIVSGFSVGVLGVLATFCGAALSVMSSVKTARDSGKLLTVSVCMCAGATMSLAYHVLMGQALQGFTAAGYSAGATAIYTSVCVFGGVAAIFGVEKLSSIALSRSVNDIDVLQNMNVAVENGTPTPSDNIPTMEKGESESRVSSEFGSVASEVPDETDEHSRIHSAVQLRRLVYSTWAVVFVSSIPQGILLYSGLTRILSFALEIQVCIVAINTVFINFPYGLAIALPAFQLNGKKYQSVLLAVCASSGQLIGCIFSWLFIDSTDPVQVGIIRGINVGMLLCFALREMLPTARFVDPSDKWVSSTTFFTIVIMQLLFSLAKYAFF